MKYVVKRLTKTPVFRRFLSWCAASYIRLVYVTSTKTITIDDAARPYYEGELPAVYAFWHGRMLLLPTMAPKKRGMHVMISTHRDGLLIAQTMQRFRLGIVSGSTSRGASGAAMQATKLLAAGDNVSITPDGPRGPCMQAQEGVAAIAQLAKVPVIPVAFSCTRYKVMRSWDRFLLALPFGRIYYCVGAPLWADRKDIEQAMIAITAQADEMAGISV